MLAALVVFLLAPAAPVPTPPENCDAAYDGVGQAQDFAKALACYRSQEAWAMVAIMQLNGEGTAVDVAAARASFARLVGASAYQDADADKLGVIIKAREANPTAKAPRVDFCRDVASTTVSLDPCQQRALDQQIAKDDRLVKSVRDHLPPPAQGQLDHVVKLFQPFARAEADRAYQEYISGSIRGTFSMRQETMVRENFITFIKSMAVEATAPPAPRSPFAAADRALNAVYRQKVRSYAAGETKATAAACRTKARNAQHFWIQYRDAAADFAASRWPNSPSIKDVVKALVTEDRIRELQNSMESRN